MRLLKYFILCLFLFFSSGLIAQITEPRWEVISSQNFDLYLPKSSELDYNRLLNDAEKHLTYCESLFDYHINESIRLVLSRNENIVKLPISLNNSHSTEVEFDRHTGYVVSNADYDDILLQTKNAIVTILFNDLMYGKTFQDRIQNSAILQVHNWFLKGLVAYCNEPWNGHYDGLMRDYFLRNKSPGFNVLIEQNETLAGYSFWKYILNQYGEQNISNTLYISHLSRSIESGLYFVFGKDYATLMKEWQGYYKLIYLNEFPSSKNPSNSFILHTNRMQKIEVSPDGKYIAGVCLGAFNTKVYCLDLQKSKRQLVKTLNGNADVILRWKMSGSNAQLIYNISGLTSDILLFYSPSKRRTLNWIPVKDFDKLINFDIDEYNNFVFYGVKKSKTYFVHYSSESQILKTLLTDVSLLDIRILEDNVYYALNSSSESLLISNRNKIDTLLRFPKSSVFKILSVDSLNIYFIANFSGLNQVYQYNLNLKFAKVFTNFLHYSSSITAMPFGEHCYYTQGSDTKIHVGIVNFHELSTDEQPVAFFTLNPKGQSQKPVPFQIDSLIIDSSANGNEINNKYYFLTGFKDDNRKDYQLLLDSLKQAMRSNKINLSISKNYELNFATLKVSLLQLDNTNYLNMIDLAPLSPNGTNNYFSYHYAKSEMALKDILNKYQLFGGFRLSANLGGGYDAFFRFEKNYRRYILQASVYYYQKRNIPVANNQIVKQQIQSTAFSYTYKLSNTSALKAGLTIMPSQNSILSTEWQGLIQPNFVAFVTQVNVAYHYNRLKKYNDFLFQGVSFQFEPICYFNSSTRHFNSVIKGIAKYYKPICRRIIWSNQLLVNTSQGKDKVASILGGAENWIFARYYDQNQLLEQMNYRLRLYGGAVRGFQENARNGNNSFCLNTELRIPISTFFSKWPTDKFWYQKLIIIPFADLGSAWNGLNLFDKSNNYTSRVFDFSTSANGVARVEVKNLRNPLLGSFGCGINTRIIGYNLRFDVAYGIEDGLLKKPMYMLSYGTNF